MTKTQIIFSYILLSTCHLRSWGFGLGLPSPSSTFSASTIIKPFARNVHLLSKHDNPKPVDVIKTNAYHNDPGKEIPSMKRFQSKLWYRSIDVDEYDKTKLRNIPKSFFRKIQRRRIEGKTKNSVINDKKIHLISDYNNEDKYESEGLQNFMENNATAINGNGLGKGKKIVVKDLHNLREAILNGGYELKDIEIVTKDSDCKTHESKSIKKNLKESSIFNHEVLKLIEHRARTDSKPGNRPSNDTAILALSIEGGGMRGAVSAGMVSAIACLGLCDTFDSIYGSSAGSVIGAYMISRQMCIDVYTEVIPIARKRFVSKLRLISSLIVLLVDKLLLSTSKVNFGLTSQQNPAMNISFLLDGVMDPISGLRPLDVTSFQSNDRVQPLRVVSSAVHDGKMKTFCLGSNDGDFFGKNNTSTGDISAPTFSDDNSREGLFACLQASMTVPGATGPPVNLNRNLHRRQNSSSNSKLVSGTSACFDAFCFEPIPYRSAVEEGATHVLVLRSKPEGCTMTTKPAVYEKTVAPLYFNINGFPQVGEYFNQGGQQYRYLEDVMTLDEGKRNIAGSNEDNFEGVLVPPTEIFYGLKSNASRGKIDTSTWKKAHLLPITVPNHKDELPTLENGEDEVLQAVRDGFAAAFDILAPLTGLKLEANFDGDRVAELIFPKRDLSESVLQNQVLIEGETILQHKGNDCSGKEILHERKKFKWLKKFRSYVRSSKKSVRSKSTLEDTINSLDPKELEGFLLNSHQQDAVKLLACLPGIKPDKISPLSSGLHWIAGSTINRSERPLKNAT